MRGPLARSRHPYFDPPPPLSHRRQASLARRLRRRCSRAVCSRARPRVSATPALASPWIRAHRCAVSQWSCRQRWALVIACMRASCKMSGHRLCLHALFVHYTSRTRDKNTLWCACHPVYFALLEPSVTIDSFHAHAADPGDAREGHGYRRVQDPHSPRRALCHAAKAAHSCMCPEHNAH